MGLQRLGKYEIKGELGRGAMGVVYRGYDPALDREVALKMMAVALPALGGDETSRFYREARSVARLKHPNIVTIYELGHEGDVPYIAMELLDGTDLAAFMRGAERPPLSRRLEIVARLCDGLDFAHRNGIVHRDVKPANVFIQRDGTLKILDFGLAKFAYSGATRSGMILGTVDYMSPEQILAQRDLDGRSDLFSAGVMLYEMLFHRKPFEGSSLSSTMYLIVHSPPLAVSRLDEVLPREIAAILRRALEKPRENRYQTGAEMASDLHRAAASVAGAAGDAIDARIERAIREGAFDRRESVTSEAVDPSTVPTRTEAVGEPGVPRSADPAARLRTAPLIGPVASGRASEPNVRRPAFAATYTPLAAAHEGRRRRRTMAVLFAVAAVLAAGAITAFILSLRSASELERGVNAPVGTPELGEPVPSRAENANVTEGGAPPSPIEANAGGVLPPVPEGGDSQSSPSPAETNVRGVSPIRPETRSVPTIAPETGGASMGDPRGARPALPPALSAPSVGLLVVSVAPWARIESIESLDGGPAKRSDEPTPARLTLPPGRYRLRLAHPSSASPLELIAEVRAGETTIVNGRMPDLDMSRAFSELFPGLDGAKPMESLP